MIYAVLIEQFYVPYVSVVDDGSASQQWQERLVALKGEEWVTDLQFNCDSLASSKIARSLFAKARIDSITLGTLPIVLDSCS